MTTENGSIYYYDSGDILTRNPGFSTPSSAKLSQVIANSRQRWTTKKYYPRLITPNKYISTSGRRLLSKLFVNTFVELTGVRNPRIAVRILILSVIVPEIGCVV